VSEFGRQVFCEGEEIRGPPGLSPISSGKADLSATISSVSVCRMAKLRKSQEKISNYYLLVRLCRGLAASRVRLFGFRRSECSSLEDAQIPTVREYGRLSRRLLASFILTMLLDLRGISTKLHGR
jgi:hypothetical protein